MKTTRSIVPALVVLTVLVAAALAIGMMGRVGQGTQGTQADKGSNAGLSNDELVSVAITNMRALTSYHFQAVDRPLPGIPAAGPVLTLTGDLQGLRGGFWGEGNGWMLKFERDVPGLLRTDYEAWILQNLGLLTDLISTGSNTGNKTYWSSDGGATWSGGSLAGLPLSPYLYLWESPQDSYQVVDVGPGVKWADGNPLLEKIDGEITRHMVLTLAGGREWPEPDKMDTWRHRVTAIQLWVSTDDVPHVRQMRVEISGGEPGYALQFLTAKPEMPPYAQISPSGNQLAIVTSPSKSIQLWDPSRPGSEPNYIVAPEPCAGGLLHPWISISADDKVFAAKFTCIVGSELKESVYVWDLSRQSTPYRTWQPTSSFQFIFSPDTKMLVGWTKEGIYTWDWDKQAAPHLTWKLPVEWTRVRWSPDGKTLAAPAPEGIYLWDASTPEGVQIPLAISESSGVSEVEFSPDNRTLAAALKGGGIAIYDLSDPKASRRTLNLQSLYVKGFSPDGRWLITRGSDNTVISDLQQPQRPPLALPGWRVGYGSFSPQVAFSPDGRYMVTDTKEGKAELWDLNSLSPGKAPGPPIELASNRALPSPGPVEYVPEDQQAQLVPAIAFSADGQRLTVASMDGFVKQWNVADLSDPGRVAAAKPTIIMSPPDPEGFYAITYQWSRFNEDFGEIKPPPTETIK